MSSHWQRDAALTALEREAERFLDAAGFEDGFTGRNLRAMLRTAYLAGATHQGHTRSKLCETRSVISENGGG